MGVIRNGRSATIREFVKSRPGCEWRDIIAGLSALGSFREVGREITRMVRDGRLVAEREGQRLHYLPGREPAPPRRQAPKASTIAHRRPSVSRPVRTSVTVANRPAQTVEEFVAHGGTVERLPVRWEAPTRYPRCHLALHRWHA